MRFLVYLGEPHKDHDILCLESFDCTIWSNSVFLKQFKKDHSLLLTEYSEVEIMSSLSLWFHEVSLGAKFQTTIHNANQSHTEPLKESLKSYSVSEYVPRILLEGI